ncbi:hypothetical protein ABG768_021910 [Culter alburnus]|uniref:non-specific serine/threonine protein kinase n=1 Tax=Culter alburnus TaxID=194366 RepID=A0AAW2AVP6_CULAL
MENRETEKKNDGSTLIKRAWRTVKSAAGRLVKRNSTAPPRPLPDTDSAHHQPDPSVPEQKESLDLTDLELDPSFFEPPDFLDLTDLLPSFPKSPGAALKESEDPSWLRTISCPGPSPLPLSELYDVEEDIGRGYFGTVRKGIRKSDGQQVAIKFIKKLTTGRFADRFITVPGVSEPLFAEVALNLLLNRPPLSPYIVHMLDWFEEEDQYILILEYSEPCRDLYGFVLQENLSESQARSLMYQAVLAAKHCLDGGVFHRDIKLDNYVINTATNRVQLIDFGCGEVAESGIKGQFIGFACPPEYFADFEYAAEPTTVWSLGIMMHRTVCSCNPLRKEDGRLSFDSRVSAEFQELITWCLALNPSERATMEDILQHEWFRQERMSGAI